MRTILATIGAVVLSSGLALAHGPASCADIYVCEDADNDGSADDKVYCAGPAEGETPVVDDLQSEGQACGCADVVENALFIAGRAYEGGVAGCTGIAGESRSVLDTAGPTLEPLIATDASCQETAVAACKAGACAAVEHNSEACAPTE